MRFKRFLCFWLILALSVSLIGCDFATNTDELVSPPQLTGDMYPIAEALRKSVGNGYTLKYPTAGDRRSAVILEDVNGDGKFEAFAFYQTNEDELTNMHINLICQINGEWVSTYDQSIVANDVETVDFFDLNNNGVMEVLVGWKVNGNSEKILTVFSFENGALEQRLSEPYTNFLCCDLDANGDEEIFVHTLNATEQKNGAFVYAYGEEGITLVDECLMDSGVKTAETPIFSTLSNGQNAIYIDEIKGVGSVTEVLYFSRGKLVNPLLDAENSMENVTTIRAASIQTTDINSDGVLEIPIATELPSVSLDEKIYYTNWCSFNGEMLAVKLITIVNTVDGYYITLPNNLVGSVAVSKDIENHKRGVYAYDNQTGTVGERLFSICAVPIKSWKDGYYDGEQYTEITRDSENVYAFNLGDTAAEWGITDTTLNNIFNLMQKGD